MNTAVFDETLILNASHVEKTHLAKMVGVTTLTVEEVLEDVKKVASTVASMYTDQSCFALAFDELYQECMRKFVATIEAGYLSRPRGEFFKLVKTAMNNHVRGMVHKYRFTIKRTGHRPPDRDDPEAVNFKPEVSLDDPDLGLQLASVEDQSQDFCDADEELIQDVKANLTPIESLVLDQLVNPNPGAFIQAYLKAAVGHKRGTPLNVKVDTASLAYGLGLEVETFLKIQESIQQKAKTTMSDKPEDTKYNAALATLEHIYDVQVPRSTERVVIARLFTIVSRDQLDKFTPDVEKLLHHVGAKAPIVRDGNLQCYGVLYQKNNRICQSCSLYASCRVEASNYGLGEISLSPKLLGGKNVRYATLNGNNAAVDPLAEEHPVPLPDPLPEKVSPPAPVEVAPKPSSRREPFTRSERDDILLNHLQEHYKRIKFKQDVYYTHRDGKNRQIFFVGREGEPFDLRLCRPSEELKQLLIPRIRSFYIPHEMPIEQALKLIDQHGSETIKRP